MPMFAWTPDLATGNADIDDQHRSLFALAEAAHSAATETADDGDAVADCVWRLTDYVVQHFADEEELMSASSYPELGPHRAQHEYLTGETMRFTARFFNGDTVTATELARFIATWLRTHIEESDRRFVGYLNAHRG